MLDKHVPQPHRTNKTSKCFLPHKLQKQLKQIQLLPPRRKGHQSHHTPNTPQIGTLYLKFKIYI